jgi:hypothetical protein
MKERLLTLFVRRREIGRDSKSSDAGGAPSITLLQSFGFEGG